MEQPAKKARMDENEDSPLPLLNDACLRHIASFMPLNDSALASKMFLEVSDETALALLTTRVKKHNADEDFLDRLKTKVAENLQAMVCESYESNSGSQPSMKKLHNRLLWKRADTIPVKRCVTPLHGPSVVLPSGNIATFATDGIRIIDTERMSIIEVHGLGFTLPQDGIGQLPIHIEEYKLFYSNGYLVLNGNPEFADRQYVHVWRLEEVEDDQVSVQFLYSKLLSQSDEAKIFQDLAVATDSKIYLLWAKTQGNREISFTIEALDITTGKVDKDTTIPMPNSMNLTTTRLVVTGSYVLMFRHMEMTGTSQEIGLGVYSFRRTDLTQSDFLPCFEGLPIKLNLDMSGTAYHSVMYVVSESIFVRQPPKLWHKKIDFDDTTGKLSMGNDVEFGPRYKVVLTTAKSVFTCTPARDDELVAIDEYDLESGKKLRTLDMGEPREGSQVVSSALVNHARGELFVSTWDQGTNGMQNFIL